MFIGAAAAGRGVALMVRAVSISQRSSAALPTSETWRVLKVSTTHRRCLLKAFPGLSKSSVQRHIHVITLPWLWNGKVFTLKNSCLHVLLIWTFQIQVEKVELAEGRWSLNVYSSYYSYLRQKNSSNIVQFLYFYKKNCFFFLLFYTVYFVVFS